MKEDSTRLKVSFWLAWSSSTDRRQSNAPEKVRNRHPHFCVVPGRMCRARWLAPALLPIYDIAGRFLDPRSGRTCSSSLRPSSLTVTSHAWILLNTAALDS